MVCGKVLFLALFTVCYLIGVARKPSSRILPSRGMLTTPSGRILWRSRKRTPSSSPARGQVALDDDILTIIRCVLISTYSAAVFVCGGTPCASGQRSMLAIWNLVLHHLCPLHSSLHLLYTKSPTYVMCCVKRIVGFWRLIRPGISLSCMMS